jgi:hypothetical protein
MSEETEYNFLVVEFGDNDYGHVIAKGIEELSSHWTENVRQLCPHAIKCFLVAYVVSCQWKKDCLWLGEETSDADSLMVLPNPNTLDWLKMMRVTFRDKMPTYEPEGYPEQLIDHDGGSAAMDLNTNYIFTF